jgi:hypothetical protein
MNERRDVYDLMTRTGKYDTVLEILRKEKKKQ